MSNNCDDKILGQIDKYPYPMVATIAVLFRNEQVLLVRRANPPNAGRWGFPGGKINRGETIEAAAIRELYEETNVTALAAKIFNAVDVFDFEDDGRLRYHFILIAVLCTWVSGEPTAGSDALEACFFNVKDVSNEKLNLNLNVKEIALQGAELLRNRLSG